MSENQTPTPETEVSQPTTATPAAPTAAASRFGVPASIVLGAVIIAGAVIYTGQESGPTAVAPSDGVPAQETPEINIEPVTKDDHIRGNPNAPIMIVEYSDYDCPFCKRFHEDTMGAIMDEYGADGQVAWVYRHFPLEVLHPNAAKVAEASECVAELGGNEAFWTFSDLVFGERGTNSPTDMTQLPSFATQSGVSVAAFNECLDSGKYTEQIAADVQEAIAAGAKGTPHSYVIGGGQQITINGAQPFQNVKASIDAILETI